MGEAGFAAGEHLLILRPFAWPDSWHDDLRRAFPTLQITALEIEGKPLEEYVPKGKQRNLRLVHGQIQADRYPEILAESTIIAFGGRHLPLPESIPQ